MADACEYRIIATNFICIVSTWEQQLFNFCNKFIKKVNNNYHDIKKEYINTGVDTILFENLKEYRWVCNVLKHGKETRDFTKLKENNSIFINKNLDFIGIDENNFNMPVLNINYSNIIKLCNDIENFWIQVDLFFENNN